MCRRRKPSRRALAASFLVAFLLSGCRGGTVTAFRVEHDAASLQSIATDGAMTANSAVKGDATEAFTHTHARELGDEAAELASVLASAHPKRGLADETTKLIALARAAAETFERLESHPSDKAAARRARADLERVARRAEELGKSE